MPLEKYKRFIENVEKELLFDRRGYTLIRIRGLTRMATRIVADKSSSNVVARIVKRGGTFSIKYACEGFNKIYLFDEKVSVSPRLRSVLFRVRRISSRNLLTHRILKGIIEHQREYLRTGSPLALVPFSQVQLTDWINKDSYSVYRRPCTETKYDISWTSRLVSRLAIITPSGEEKSLKWFFQTRKDINKRFLKQLFDKESEDLQSGRLKKPYTDNELRTMLEVLLCEKAEQRFTNHDSRITRISRHSIGLCRKDMGIPSAKRRLSGYKYPPLSANFSLAYPLTMKSVIKYAPAASGVYELSTKNNLRTPNYGLRINVFYIGSTGNIKKRLREHLGRNSKNGRIRDFLRKFGCSFRYIQVARNWGQEEGNLYSLFVATYGAPPECNRVRPGGN